MDSAGESTSHQATSEISSPVVDFMLGGQTDGPPVLDESNESSYTQRDLIQYHFFGRHGVPVSTRASISSWERHMPFFKPIKVKWEIKLSEHNLLRLVYGYEPLEMPDKWFIYANGPHRSGKLIVNFIRSWTGKRAAELLIQTKTDENGLWTGQVIELTFEGDEEEAERFADASLEKSSSTHQNLNEDEAGTGGTKVGLGAETEVDEATEKIEGDDFASKSIQSIDSRSDEGGEIWTKFLVITACKWVMGIDLGIEIPEPKRWTKLASQPVKESPITQTTYMGTSMPQETMELLQRLGPGTIVTFS